MSDYPGDLTFASYKLMLARLSRTREHVLSNQKPPSAVHGLEIMPFHLEESNGFTHLVPIYDITIYSPAGAMTL